MGCGRKTKKYANISNNRVVPDENRPEAIKQSTSAYINDLPKMTNRWETSLVDYNTLGINNSIVNAFKKARKYTKTYKYSFMDYKAQSLSFLDPNNLYDLFIDKLKEEYGEDINVDYFLFEANDYAHFLKEILQDDFSFDYYKNTLVFNDKEYWLEDAYLTLKELPDIAPMGSSFKSGITPIREEDRSRKYTKWQIEKPEEDLNILSDNIEFIDQVDEEKATLKLIPKQIKNYVETTIETVEILEDGSEVITDTENTSDILEDTTTLTSSLAEQFSDTKTTIETVTIDENHKKSITTKTHNNIYYDEVVTNEILLKEYFTYLPSDITKVGNEGEDSQEVIDNLNQFKDDVESGNISTDIFSSIYILVASFDYEDDDGNRIKVFKTFTDNNYPEFRQLLFSNVNVLKEIDLMPNLYFQIHGKRIAHDYRDHAVYKASKRYAIRLGLDYRRFYDQVFNEMKEDDRNKIRTSYITFGLDIDRRSRIHDKYLYEFFEAQIAKKITINYNDINQGKNTVNENSITQTDKYGQSSVSWEKIDFEIKEGILETDYGYLASNGVYRDDPEDNSPLFSKPSTIKTYYAFKKQISETHYAQVTVYNFRRNAYVHNGKWGKASNDTALLVPLDYQVLKEHFKAFKDKEELIYKSMYLEFLTYVEIKQKWYETTIFKVVIAAVGAAITVATGGAGAISMSAFIKSLVINIAISVAVDIAVQIVIKAFGAKNGRILATVVAIAAIIWGGLNALSVSSQGFNKALTVFFMKATTLINFSNKLLMSSGKSLNDELTKDIEEIKKEIKDLETHADNMFGSSYNDATISYLGSNRNYISPLITLGDTIDDVMYKVTNYNKIDTCIDYINNYPEIILALPTPQETLQKITKGI